MKHYFYYQYADTIERALKSLNVQYGRGSVYYWQFTNKNHTLGMAYIKKQYGNEIIKFRIEKNSVHFRGHQKLFR